MSNEKEPRRLVEQYRRQANIEVERREQASVNPPNDGGQRPAPPAGSGGNSGTNQGGSPPSKE